MKPLDVPALDPCKGSPPVPPFSLCLPTSPALLCGPWVMSFVLQDLCIISLVSETSWMVFDEMHPTIIVRTTRSGSTTNLVFVGEINCGIPISKMALVNALCIPSHSISVRRGSNTTVLLIPLPMCHFYPLTHCSMIILAAFQFFSYLAFAVPTLHPHEFSLLVRLFLLLWYKYLLLRDQVLQADFLLLISIA